MEIGIGIDKGAFKVKSKKTATEIIKVLTSLMITEVTNKSKDVTRIWAERLFNIDGADVLNL